jgi:hypothetical protein
MKRFARSFATVAFLASGITAANAMQQIPDGELQRFVYQTRFPVQCGDAGIAVSKMRQSPTTSPPTLHGMIRTFVDCAKGPWSKSNGALFNTSVFAASAAALLAARHEHGLAATVDAHNALHGAKLITAYQSGTRPGLPSRTTNPYAPSPYITDANRIKTDAQELLAGLPPLPNSYKKPPDATPDFPATPAPGRGNS